MLTTTDLLETLTTWGIPFEEETHAPVATMADSAGLDHALTGERCKSLLLKDKKKRLFLVSVPQATGSIDLTTLREALGSARLSFARPEDLHTHLGVTPGALSPLAAINMQNDQVTVVLEASLLEKPTLLLHPLVNTATISIAGHHLRDFLASAHVTPVLLPSAAFS